MNFESALDCLFKAEGLYSNHKFDSGGITLAGLARNKNPDLKVWEYFDKYIERGNTPEQAAKLCMTNPETLDLIKATYRGRYWNPCECDKLPSIIRYPVFNCAVNCGHIQAGKFLQRAVGATVDGIIGRKTINATILAKKQPLLDKFYAQWATFYDLIVQRKPEQKRFLNGWKNRIADVQKDNHE